MAKQFIDILIPIHGALPYLKKCVESVVTNTNNYRLIFVNDFSNDPEMDEFLNQQQQRFPNSLVVKTGRQSWFTRAVNIGLRLVRTERVVILNSDTECGEGWLEELEDNFDELVQMLPHKEVGMVGSFLVGKEHPRYKETRKNTSYSYVTGHCLLVSMNSLHRVAFQRGTPGWMFNELEQQQIHIASDRVMCWDMNALGIATFVNYHALVHHADGKSWDHDLGKALSVQLDHVDWSK